MHTHSHRESWIVMVYMAEYEAKEEESYLHVAYSAGHFCRQLPALRIRKIRKQSRKKTGLLINYDIFLVECFLRHLGVIFVTLS